MQYVWNPQFDVFCLRDRVDFVALNQEISIAGDAVARALRNFIELTHCRKGGFAWSDAAQLWGSYSESDVHRLWSELVQAGLVKDMEPGRPQIEPSLPKGPGFCLFEQLPLELPMHCCHSLGFRFGGLYFLASSSQSMVATQLAKSVIEWAFSGTWLDRARSLFWPTGECLIAGPEFIPLHTRQWLQLTIHALLKTSGPDCLYEIDLRSLAIRREELSSTSVVGVLSPVVQQDDVTSRGQQGGFIPNFSVVLSRYRQPDIWDGAQQYSACGAHPNPWTARSISAAEAVERSAAAAWRTANLSFGRLGDDSRRIDPRYLINLDRDQQDCSGLHQFGLDKSYYWCDAIDLVDDQEAQIVADLCYFPFHPLSYDRRFAWGNSSGMAAGQTLAGAQQSAFFELIERDAFMVTWIAKRSAPHVHESLIPLVMRESSGQLKLIGYETALIDITIRGVPTVLAVAYRKEWPALIIGVASRNTLLEAMCAAWKEVEVGIYCRLLDSTMKENKKPLLQPENVNTADDHAKFFNHPDHLQHASFLWGSTVESRSPLLEPFFKDITERSVVSLCRQMAIDQMYMVHYGCAYGLQIVRLLTPQFVPLTFGYNQLPWQQVSRCSVPGVCGNALQDAFPVHPLD